MIQAHPIPGRITHHEISKVQPTINAAPVYSGKVKSALSHTIEVIHGLPKMHRTLKLRDIEIYIGKSNRTASAVLKRWMSHRKDRKHIFGLVLFRCSLQNAKKLEKVAIRVVKSLKAKNCLCVGEANLSQGSGGNNANSDESLIYITWCPLATPTAYSKPRVSDIKNVAKEVYPSVQNLIKEQQIIGGLMAVKRISRYKKSTMNYY